MSSSRACLFGGTLLAAGLTSPALGQEFVIGDVFSGFFANVPGANAYVYAYGSDMVDAQTGPASGPQSVAASLGGQPASITLGANEMVAQTSRDAAGFFTSFSATTSFQLTQDAEVFLEWAVDEDLTQSNRVFQILGPDSGVIFDYISTATPGAGTGSVNLLAGVDYTLITTGDTFNGNDTTALFFSATVVPAPGAAALFCLGGAATLRRRRA